MRRWSGSFGSRRMLHTSAMMRDGIRPLQSSLLTVSSPNQPKPIVPNDELVFGRTFTDHMLTVEWTAKQGWGAPAIVPFQNLSLDPASCVLHYGFECFEGMKAYKDDEGRLRLFRPDLNMRRFSKSSQRISLPDFDESEMIKLIGEFIKTDERWVPKEKGYSLYLRPTHIGTQKTLGVGPVNSSMIFVIASPVGPYYKGGFKAIKVLATETIARAWPGGVGDAKVGGNYAPTVKPLVEAAREGYSANLFLMGPEGYVSEAGTMNVFTCWVDEAGVKEIITPPLDGTILEGVTRDSVLALARERLEPEGWRVREDHYTIHDLVKASKESRLLEMFGSGTAAIVSPIESISYRGETIPTMRDTGMSERMHEWITRIQRGQEPNHPWSVPV